MAGWKMDPDWRCIPYWKWGFSIAMLVYWSVNPLICVGQNPSIWSVVQKGPTSLWLKKKKMLCKRRMILNQTSEKNKQGKPERNYQLIILTWKEANPVLLKSVDSCTRFFVEAVEIPETSWNHIQNKEVLPSLKIHGWKMKRSFWIRPIFRF